MKTYKERTERILEKATAERRKKQMRTKKLTAALSCGLAAVLAINLALFIPRGSNTDLIIDVPPIGDDYPPIGDDDPPIWKDPVVPQDPVIPQDYVTIVEKLRTLQKEYPIIDSDTDFSESKPGVSTSPGDPAPDDTQGKYEETTDNQVEGVIEGDIFKRSGNTVFYLTHDYELQAYSIAGESSELIGELNIKPNDGMRYYFSWSREMFLSEDLSAVTVLTSCYSSSRKQPYTAIITINTENATTMSVSDVQYFSGSYVSSRMIDGNLLIVTRFGVDYGTDYSQEWQYIPQYGSLGNMRSIPADDILLPACATEAAYTVLTTLSDTGDLLDTKAFLSYSQEVYVSQNACYVTNEHASYRFSYLEQSTRYNGYYTAYYYGYATDFTRVPFDKDGDLKQGATVTVDGTIHDRFSMDEYEDHFRVFVTTNNYLVDSGIAAWGGSGSVSGNLFINYGQNASLFVFNAKTLELVASVERFAPYGETVQSARFDGNTAYVCTAVRFTDPVFAFDLSDLDNITCTNSGTISGYSTTLTKFTDGLLLGIGHNKSSSDLKIELYDENAQSVAVYLARGNLLSYTLDYKAYFIGREPGIIGLGVCDIYSAQYKYLLIRWDGETLKEIACIPIGCVSEDARAFYADGFFYLLDGTLQVFPLD